jgi:hypothetical protein
MRKSAGAIVLPLVVLLAGCAINGPNEGKATVGRVLIREQGRIVTTYDLGRNGKMLNSSTQDRYGVTVTRKYLYDAQNKLASVTKRTPTTSAETLIIANEADKTDLSRPARTVKTRGATTMSVQYIYAEDGKLAGLLEKDAAGNIQAKGPEE